jgi:hypothetical protein
MKLQFCNTLGIRKPLYSERRKTIHYTVISQFILQKFSKCNLIQNNCFICKILCKPFHSLLDNNFLNNRYRKIWEVALYICIGELKSYTYVYIFRVTSVKSVLKTTNIVASGAVSKQRSHTNRFPRKQSSRNNRGTLGDDVFYDGPYRG